MKKRNLHKMISGFEHKQCDTCKRWLSLFEFSECIAAWDGLYYKCKLCHRAYRQEYHKTHIIAVQQHVNLLKSYGVCAKCGHSFHPAAMDYHHRDPKKKETAISTLVNRGASIERIDEEIAKCDLMCSNCHRILHYEMWND